MISNSQEHQTMTNYEANHGFEMDYDGFKWWKYLNNVEIDGAHKLCSWRFIKFLKAIEQHIIAHAMWPNKVCTQIKTKKKPKK